MSRGFRLWSTVFTHTNTSDCFFARYRQQHNLDMFFMQVNSQTRNCQLSLLRPIHFIDLLLEIEVSVCLSLSPTSSGLVCLLLHFCFCIHFFWHASLAASQPQPAETMLHCALNEAPSSVCCSSFHRMCDQITLAVGTGPTLLPHVRVSGSSHWSNKQEGSSSTSCLSG